MLCWPPRSVPGLQVHSTASHASPCRPNSSVDLDSICYILASMRPLLLSPAGLRMSKAHVTHPELKATFSLDILGVKKNPNGAMYSSLGVITKGEGRRPCAGGKVIWGFWGYCWGYCSTLGPDGGLHGCDSGCRLGA